MNAPKPWSEMTWQEIESERQNVIQRIKAITYELSKIALVKGTQKRHLEPMRESTKKQLEISTEQLRELNEHRRRLGSFKSNFGRRGFQLLMDLVIALEGVELPKSAKELIEEAKTFPDLVQKYAKLSAEEF